MPLERYLRTITPHALHTVRHIIPPLDFRRLCGCTAVRIMPALDASGRIMLGCVPYVILAHLTGLIFRTTDDAERMTLNAPPEITARALLPCAMCPRLGLRRHAC
jgi:hypothetical protein